MQEATYSRSEPERWREQVSLVFSQLDEKQRRLVAGLLSNAVGRGGVTVLSRITGLDRKTVRRGRDELDNGLQDCPADRVRREGAGHPPVEKKVPASSKN
ncbi:MAG: transposase [Planctomycetes bacterium]|nr:transposase [Planctomycetota bacterium]